MERSISAVVPVIVMAFAVGAVFAGAGSADAKDDLLESCPTAEGGVEGTLLPGDRDDPPDLEVTQPCTVGAGHYYYKNVNIYGNGTLTFLDEKIDFYAQSILIEKGGSLIAGRPATVNDPDGPIGSKGGVVTIHLWGKDQGVHGQGIVCQSKKCGVPDTIWDKPGTQKVPLPDGTQDYFYSYEPLPYDDASWDPNANRNCNLEGCFGYKVLAVSWGGTLRLFGKKGATYGNVDPSDSGTSWRRLTRADAKQTTVLQPGETILTLDRAVDWQGRPDPNVEGGGDQIVLTSTDYLPGHSEQLTIKSVSSDGKTITLEKGAAYPHARAQVDLGGVPAGIGPDVKVAETRAAVALLTRSIRIVSEGDKIDQPLAAGSYFGGHTVVRQGVLAYQVQGVEFYQLGQGGRLGHYPVHAHKLRKTNPDTHFLKDSSIHDSMTRWVTLHSTHSITVARVVGYLSIGHGFYLEDGTEIDNKFHSNIGIFARAAVDNPHNPRKVPGILASPDKPGQEMVPFHSDYDHPTVFWIMNGWNEFEGNMAVGAGACGACYWLVPGAISGHSRHQTWESYAALQHPVKDPFTNQELGIALARAATTPLKKFKGNYCSTAMNSFNTIGDTAACIGVGPGQIEPIANPFNLPNSCDQSNPKFVDGNGVVDNTKYAANACILSPDADDYYPKVSRGGGRFATLCDDGNPAARCSQGPNRDQPTVPICATSQQDPTFNTEKNCALTVLDHYTSGFHWAETNLSAIWLRPQWYLMINSVLHDVQNAGLSFITGGGYTRSDTINGHWALARKNAFIGSSQEGNAYASNAGPFNGETGGLECDTADINHCRSKAEGISMPLSNFGVNQRLFNIYDGPAYQDSNAYLDINPTFLTDCHPDTDTTPHTEGKCASSKWMYGRILGIPRNPDLKPTDPKACYLPNAAIAWKQPNGFYYPPAFHSRNLYFDNVDIRHFVIEPRLEPGTYKTNAGEAQANYCTWGATMFTGFTDIDRQTELNDDDGSLTGYANTISVNEDPLFTAPVEAFECASDQTAKTSPYDYVTTVVYPGCGLGCGSTGGPSSVEKWSVDCANPRCHGVPLYRQYLTKPENAAKATPFARMAGQSQAQRSILTANHGAYYIDTAVSEQAQRDAVRGWATDPPFLNLFERGKTYYVFLVFAKPSTRQTYQLYVGPNFDDKTWSGLSLARADVTTSPTKFTPGAWPQSWTREYDSGTGILTVTIDLAAFAGSFGDEKPTRCRPFSFCTWNDTAKQCKCALKGGDYLFSECSEKNAKGEDAICAWAVEDVDCPKGGCFGFGVTLTSGFDYLSGTEEDPRVKLSKLPAASRWPRCFPKDKDWNVSFTPADPPELAGACADAPVLPTQFCDATQRPQGRSGRR
jgi:hypothetical protein